MHFCDICKNMHCKAIPIWYADKFILSNLWQKTLKIFGGLYKLEKKKNDAMNTPGSIILSKFWMDSILKCLYCTLWLKFFRLSKALSVIFLISGEHSRNITKLRFTLYSNLFFKKFSYFGQEVIAFLYWSKVFFITTLKWNLWKIYF